MKYNFKRVVPFYSGGGFIIFIGETDEFYFSASNMEPGILEMDVFPIDENGDVCEYYFDGDFYEKHMSFAPVEDENDFYMQMLLWVKDNVDEQICRENLLDIDYEINEAIEYSLHS